MKLWIIAPVSACSLAAQTPADLFRAARENDLKTLKAADVNWRGERGNTLLTYAASFGTPEAVKLLLDRGADVEAKSQFDATALKVRAIAQALIATQRADGGWAQNRNLFSDAYATGETLWAVREAGALVVTEPVYRRGVKVLLDTQLEDGSWYVRSRAVKLQPYFQGGFPFDHDQWISSTATGYAVMAPAPVR